MSSRQDIVLDLGAIFGGIVGLIIVSLVIGQAVERFPQAKPIFGAVGITIVASALSGLQWGPYGALGAAILVVLAFIVAVFVARKLSNAALEANSDLDAYREIPTTHRAELN